VSLRTTREVKVIVGELKKNSNYCMRSELRITFVVTFEKK